MRRFTGLLAAALAVSLGWMGSSGVALAAQNNPSANAPADLQLAGTVRTADGTPIPGSTLRVIQGSTGKAWVTWTDESGKFEFPALPAGHYRVEISQLGFVPANRDVDLVSGTQAPLDLKLDVASLAEISAPTAANRAATPNESAKTASLNSVPPNSSAPPAANQSAGAATNGASGAAPGRNAEPQDRGYGGARGGRGGPGGENGGPGQGAARRAFQQVALSGMDQLGGETTEEVPGSSPETGGQLGQAASADAVQMIGTVAMGQTQNPMDGFPQPGQGGPDAMGPPGAEGNAIPGQAGPMGGGGFGGGPGGGRFGGGRGRGGPRGGPPGIDALWGVQRVLRQRINRMHYSIYNTFGDSALNARPYSLYEANPPKISSWTESAGFNMGGPLKIPHVYDGTDKTFFFINFGGAWSRSPV
ncbi:MAG: carboxypeptidase-like regulatory domain-containing protein, partial [Candidatus Acidiferrales bacterium]